MTAHPAIAAVIVTHNRLDDLKETLARVRGQTVAVTSIVVVDNACSDGTSEWLDSQADVTTIHQANIGVSGGFYVGLREAYRGGAVAWTMDDDAWPEPDALAELLAHWPGPGYPAITGSMVVAREDAQLLAFHVPLVDSYSPFLDHYMKLTNSVDVLRSHATEGRYPWLMIYNSMLVPEAVIRVAGPPDPKYFAWGDEVEWLHRMRAAGVETYIVTSSITSHPISSGAPHKSRRPVYSARNKVQIHRRYRRWWRLRTAARIAIYVVKGNREVLGATFDGIRGNFRKAYGIADARILTAAEVERGQGDR